VSDWIRVAETAAVTGAPLAVTVAGQRIALVRLAQSGPVRAFLDHCPHRLVPLSAGTLTDGRLRCAYHGWEFNDTGRCVELPSAGPGQGGPPRSALTTVPVRESDGAVWVQPPPAEPEPALLTNLDPALARAWHPVALASELGAEPYTATLLGQEWRLTLVDGELAAQPRPAGLTQRWGLVWLAPQAPLVPLFEDPDTEDATYVGGWLPPARSPASAGVVADNFLDVAHFPFVHAGTFGAAEAKVVEGYDVRAEPDGCRSVQEQWFDNPGDPGVAAGIRPVRQRRRATYVYRAPFQLLLRLEELDAGAVKTILFFAQPEQLRSTRIYTKMLLHGIGGAAAPGPDVLAAEIAFEEAVLAEDLALQRSMVLPGLPLRPRDELHVRADRLGVALRRVLSDFLARAEA
jgi:phenylpropionate dioxygenase-like ring-hydroxylating dioxygenase large terminal subunit